MKTRIKGLFLNILYPLFFVPLSLLVLYRYLVIGYEYLKNAESIGTAGILVIVFHILILVGSMLLGFYFLRKYKRTKKVIFLLLGLLLTLFVPGLFWVWSVSLYDFLYPAPEVTCYMVALSTYGVGSGRSKNFNEYRRRLLDTYSKSLPKDLVIKTTKEKFL